MRQVVLDTETTGLEPALQHRIIEIGCVELHNRRLTERRYHTYLQPDRDIDPGAQAVHGIRAEFLADKPRFADVANEFLGFLEGAELIIHNAPFDVGFINYELSKLSGEPRRVESICSVIDSLVIARDLHPGQRNNLDALCKRYSIDNSQRELHGALLDAEILADVYLAMTGGQATLELTSLEQATAPGAERRMQRQRPCAPLPIIRATDSELSDHYQRLEQIDTASGGKCVWKRIDKG